MTSLLHLSDLHFGTEQPEVVEALVRLVREHRPGLMVLSGDITQRARRSQFEAARRFVDRLGIPNGVVIPGNHDIPLYNLPARLTAPYAGFHRAFGNQLEPSFESPDWLVLCVNTTRWWRHKHGQVSRAQVRRVADRLRRALPGQRRVVVTHQPISVCREQDVNDRLRGHASAARQWAEAGADLVLGGHIHLPYVQPLSDAIAGIRRPVWAVQAGTGVSSRIRWEVGHSVNLVHPGSVDGARSCVVERWDFRPGPGEFEKADLHALVSG